MRMPAPDADPNNFRRTFRRKCSYAYDRQKKGAENNRAEFFAQRKIDIFRNVAEEAERQMHLGGFDPPDAANLWIEIDQNLFGGFRQINRNEQPFRHRTLFSSLMRLASRCLFRALFIVACRRAIGQTRYPPRRQSAQLRSSA